MRSLSTQRCTESEHIVHAALHLIESRGPHRVEPADVVRHLTIPRARYRAGFPRDLDLWAAVATWIRRRMRADWDRVPEEDISPKAKLRSPVAVQVGLVAATPAIPGLVLGPPEAPARPPYKRRSSRRDRSSVRS